MVLQGKNDPVLGIRGSCWPREAGSGRDRSGWGWGRGRGDGSKILPETCCLRGKLWLEECNS